MALKLIANYSKRLGLPGYSSHQFSVCVETEISNIDDVAGESSRLYEQAPVNTARSLPAATNGSNGHGSNGHTNGDGWHCSDKQRELILKLVEQHTLDKQDIEHLSREMFGSTVKDLNKLQASGLIDRILEEHGGRSHAPRRNGGPPRQRQYSNGGSR